MRILAIDIGLASMGWALVDVVHGVNPAHIDDTHPGVTVIGCGVIETKKEAKKRQLHSSSDDARRIDELVDALNELKATGAQVYTYELPAGQKGARAAHALGIAHGLVRSTLRVGGMPVVENTARDAKAAMAGDASASKESVIACAMRIRGAASPLSKIPKTKREHAADAIANAICAAQTPTARMVASTRAA